MLVYEQRFPHGLNASSVAPLPSSSPSARRRSSSSVAEGGSGSRDDAITGLAPLMSWPSFGLDGPVREAAWRSWSGTYGSFSGVGLNHNTTIVFNGVPTMPLLFFQSNSTHAAPSVVVSPLDLFKDHAHGAVASAHEPSWRHGPSSRFESLPPGFSMSTILVAARGQTAAMAAWGSAMRTWHGTNRSEALAHDVTTSRIGYWTDNGAFYNFNKWAGNLWPGREWSPRKDPSQSPDVLLSATLSTLRKSGVNVGYLQLDDWYYDGIVYEGAVSCVNTWEGRRDGWFPRGLADFSKRVRTPLLLYVPYLCNTTEYARRFPLSFEAPSKVKHGGVADAAHPSTQGCAWPQNKTCAGVFALPSPDASEAFYSSLFDLGLKEGMVSFEHDFVGQDSLDFGWDATLGAGSAWIQGMGKAAASRRVPMQLCLATASDLLESLTMPWVTNSRASGDYAFCSDTNWDIGYPSMLHWAMAVRPFKDVFWTTPRQPGSPYDNTTLLPRMYHKCLDAHGRHAQKNTGLDALVSAFSTGPVGIGDGNGFTDTALALATCRADGTLLQPSKPLTPLDRAWWPASGSSKPGGHLGSYSALSLSARGGDAGVDGAADMGLWQYVVAVDTPCATAVPIHPHLDLYWPRVEGARRTTQSARHAVLRRGHVVSEWGRACKHGEAAYVPGSCVSLLADGGTTPGAAPTFRACTTPGDKFPNGTHVWSLTTLAPMLSGAGWVLLGEVDKFVSASSGRFANIDGSDEAVLRVDVHGTAGEAVRLLVVSPLPNALVLHSEARIPETIPAGEAASCRIDAATGSAECKGR